MQLLRSTTFLLSGILSFSLVGCDSPGNPHRATHKILWTDETPTETVAWGPATVEILNRNVPDSKDDKKVCGMTAVGPYVFLTAAHCAGTTTTISIDGEDAEIADILEDGSDHMLVFMKKYWFADWVKISPEPFEQKQKFYLYGNPHLHEDLYREGYVMGRERSDIDGTQMVLELNGFYGDSGSGLFNSSGEVVTVLSKIWIISLPHDDPRYTMKTMGAYDLHFRKSDLDFARTYNPSKDK